MCKTVQKVRPGLAGIVDYVDVINSVHGKLTPVFSLLILAETQTKIDMLDNDELSHLGVLLRDLLEEVWQAADGIYERYREVQS